MAHNGQTVIEIVILFQGHRIVYPPHLLNAIPVTEVLNRCYVNI